MQYKSVKGFTGWGQLGILLAFVGAGLIITAVIQLFIGYQLVPEGVSAEKMPEVMESVLLQPENIAFARLAQVLGTLFLMFVPAWLFALVVYGRKAMFWLGFNKYVNAQQLAIGFGLIFLANLLSVPFYDLSKWIAGHFPDLNALAQRIEATYEEQVLLLSKLNSWPEFFMALLIIAFFPALFEEVFFRGAMQNMLEKWWRSPVAAIIFTSLFFSLIHLSIYLFLSRAVLGFVLGWMFYRTRNIWVCVFAHFLNNAIAVSQLFYFTLKKKDFKMDDLDPSFPWWVSVFNLAILIGLCLLLERYSTANKQRIARREMELTAQQSQPFGNY